MFFTSQWQDRKDTGATLLMVNCLQYFLPMSFSSFDSPLGCSFMGGYSQSPASIQPCRLLSLQLAACPLSLTSTNLLFGLLHPTSASFFWVTASPTEHVQAISVWPLCLCHLKTWRAPLLSWCSSQRTWKHFLASFPHIWFSRNVKTL